MATTKKEKTYEVIAVYIHDEFKQYLKKSEARFIPRMCADCGGKVTVELRTITEAKYKAFF